MKKKKPSWSKATHAQQQHCMKSIAQQLSKVVIPETVQCTDVHCKNEQHRSLWCILLLEGHKLNCQELQFGFQPGTSTNACSWALNSVIEYYNSEGSPVYSCTMDLSKAFDFVDFQKLFSKL